MITRRNIRRTPSSRCKRQEGIALLVVMVVFIVLYLVVYQLYFSTKMEEHIAQARYGESESTGAINSAGLFVITHLIEDLKSASGSSTTEGAGTAGNPGTKPTNGPKPIGEDKKGVGGSFTQLTGGVGGSTLKNHTSLHDNLFNDNRQQVGDISVKISMVDGERMFDLNQLFDYIRIRGEEVDAAAALLSEEDMVGAVTGAKDDKDAEAKLAAKARQNSGAKASKSAKSAKSSKTTKATAASKKPGADKSGVAKVSEGGAGPEAAPDLSETALSDYENPVFETPDPVRVDETKKMVERAILMMFSINENRYGYRYQRTRKYDAGMMAQQIVDYVLERRNANYQNRIYLVTELLNLCSTTGEAPGDITPEVFYGPYPRLTEDEDFPVGDGFILRKDEFGDIVPEYQYGEDDALALEEEKKQIADLEQQFGRFMDFGGMGFDRLSSNPLTRGMQELPTNVDTNGEDYVVEIPKPIGLKDLFTTYSTGKINLNTASEPVLAGLLQSLTDEEADFVSSSIRDWRQRFRQETDAEGIQKVDSEKGSGSKSAGKSRKDKTSTKTTGAKAASSTGSAGAAGAPGLDPLAGDGSLASSYQDLDLNYFTSLDQIELVDGTDGGRDDLLRKDEGVKKVSEEDDTLYRKVINDLEKVAVFSSTYFNAELKAKPKEGRSVKTGYLTLRRDLKKKMVDVVMWKNLQK